MGWVTARHRSRLILLRLRGGRRTCRPFHNELLFPLCGPERQSLLALIALKPAKFVGGEAVRPGGDDQLAKLLQQSTFTRRDMAMFAPRYSDGIDQFNQDMGAKGNSPDLVELGRDAHGVDRFITRDMIGAEQRLHRAAEMMSEEPCQ